MTARDQLNAAIDSYTAAITPPPAPAPVDLKPWAVPITPDPSARWKAVQTALKITADGKVGNGTLTAIEKALNVAQPAPIPVPVPTPIPKPQPTLFAPSSFWYADVSNAPLRANSAAIVADFIRQTRQYYGNASRTNVTLNTTDFTPPIYIATSSTPKIDVGFYDCTSKGYFDAGLRAQFTGVPIPAGAVPAGGTDSEIVILCPETDQMWEFWQARKDASGHWSACWGGRMDNVSKSNGVFAGNYGTTATSLPFLGGLITLAERDAGTIDHALGIAVVEAAAGHVPPATRDDGGWTPGGSPIQEGMRLRFDPALDVNSLNLTGFQKAIVRAGQKHGFVVWDKAGAVCLRAENSPRWQRDDPNVWELSNLPWNRLQVLA